MNQPRQTPSFGRILQFLCWLGLGCIFIIGALSILLHYQVDPSEARRYFSDGEIQTGLDYSYQFKLLGWSSRVFNLGFLALMALTPLGSRITALIERVAGGRWFLSVLYIAGFLFLVQEVLAFPFSVFGFFRNQAWEMSTRAFGAWFLDYLQGLWISALFEVGPFLVLYLLIRWLPRAWWAPASAAGILLGVAIAFLYPVLVAPLFNTFTPLSQTEWSHLEPQVRELVNKADVEVSEILVVDASRQGKHTNAYFTGFGSTRRIVLYDTLLKDSTPEESLSILAHEIGHWRHDHIVKGLALASLGAIAGCFLLSRLLLALVNSSPWRLRSPSDPAGLPLVLLLFTIASWLSLPIQNGISRYMENQADQASIELTQKPQVFIKAEIQLCRSNKSNVTPHPVSVWLFASHPTALERIGRGERWSGR